MQGGDTAVESVFFGDGKPEPVVPAHSAHIHEARRPLIDLLFRHAPFELFVEEMDPDERVVSAVGARRHDRKAVSAGKCAGGALVVASPHTHRGRTVAKLLGEEVRTSMRSAAVSKKEHRVFGTGGDKRKRAFVDHLRASLRPGAYRAAAGGTRHQDASRKAIRSEPQR